MRTLLDVAAPVTGDGSLKWILAVVVVVVIAVCIAVFVKINKKKAKKEFADEQ